jgi:hypothetical protein
LSRASPYGFTNIFEGTIILVSNGKQTTRGGSRGEETISDVRNLAGVLGPEATPADGDQKKSGANIHLVAIPSSYWH